MISRPFVIARFIRAIHADPRESRWITRTSQVMTVLGNGGTMTKYDFDLFVIGGGSGGGRAARMA